MIKIKNMRPRAERLASFLAELQGEGSQSMLARRLKVSRSSVNGWLSGTGWPDSENLKKLASLKGWSVDDLQNYLDTGEPPTDDPLQLLVKKVRSLPLKDVAHLAFICNETLAQRLSGKEVG